MINKDCGNCQDSVYDFEKGDYTCGNPESEEYLDRVDEKYICDKWERG